MRNSQLERMPASFHCLTNEQIAGVDPIPVLPAVKWVMGNKQDTMVSRAQTLAAVHNPHIGPKHRCQPTWRIVGTWKKLSALGFHAIREAA